MAFSDINRQILHLAIPSIVSNITVPLLGLVDITIVGHLGDASYISAIAVGGTIFNIIYWIFGFLRMGTGGMTSQAYGRGDKSDMLALLMRSLVIGLIVSVILLIVYPFIADFLFSFIVKTEPAIEGLAGNYLDICIWGLPAVLGVYSFTGWFIGMQNTKIPMVVAILQNVINISVSFTLVYFFDLKIEGVALGTLVAQYCGLFLSLILCLYFYGSLRTLYKKIKVFDAKSMYRFFMVNKDIFFRTLCLVAVTLFFTSAGAAQGGEILAVNALMMQFFTIFSYIMDGFAYSAEALSGKFAGAGDMENLNRTVRSLMWWGIFMALIFMLLYFTGGYAFVSFMTDDTEVIVAANEYFYWVLLIPLAGFSAFIWDGVFIGLTSTFYMLVSMIVAAILFFTIYNLLFPIWENHALWAAFVMYLFSRGAIQTLLFKNGAVLKKWQ